MSVLTVQVGQFGNQVGGEFYRRLQRERPFAHDRLFFNEEGKARAVLVDGEAKVVQSLLKQPRSPYSPQRACYRQSGSGNNWALGYFGSGGGGNALVEEAAEALRREAEACDSHRCTVVMHSLCGGTGAGLGSRLVEAVRDEAGGGYILSVTVLPFSAGEMPLQHYNTTLCLSRVLEECDAVVSFANDDLMGAAGRRSARLRQGGRTAVRPADLAQESVGVRELNDVAAGALCGLVQPRGGGGGAWNPGEMVCDLAPMRELRMIEVWSAALAAPPRAGGGRGGGRGGAGGADHAPPSWERVSSALCLDVPKYDAITSARIHAAGCHLYARGGGGGGEPPPGGFEGVLKHVGVRGGWVDGKGLRSCGVAPWGGGERSVTVAAARSTNLARISGIATKCADMARHGAYLHHYTRFGMEEGDVANALDDVGGYLASAAAALCS